MKRKGLKKAGIDKLEKIMLANRKYYNQNVRFGVTGACGTECCGAGFAYLLEVGKQQFDSEAGLKGRYDQSDFADRCSRAGCDLLGIDDSEADIFEFSRSWPTDLREGFNKCKTPMARVRFYINMLRTRADKDGKLETL
jgi:hypothetical protein